MQFVSTKIAGIQKFIKNSSQLPDKSVHIIHSYQINIQSFPKYESTGNNEFH